MRHLLSSSLKYAFAAFVILVGLAFTPLSWMPIMLSFVFLGWEGAVVLLFIAGAPFAGYLFVVLFSPRGTRVESVAHLTGVWIGALSGSWVGLKLAGDAPWI